MRIFRPYRKDMTARDVHADAFLTNLSVAYIQDQSQYISTKVFPIVPVDKQSDKYYVMPKEAWLRDEAQKRADNTPSVGSGYELSTDQYYADVWAFHRDLGWQMRRNADASMRLRINATRFVTQRLLMRQEVQWFTDYFTTGVWATDLTPTNLWDDYTTSDPIEDVEDAKEAISSVTGFEANTMVMGRKVLRRLRNHPDIRGRIFGSAGGNGSQVSLQQLATLFEVDRIFVSRGIKATNKKGATATYSYIAGNHVWLGHVAGAPAEDVPSAGYTFSWNGVTGDMGLGDSTGESGVGVAISEFEIRETKTVRVEGEMAWDNKVVAADLGYFMPNVVT